MAAHLFFRPVMGKLTMAASVLSMVLAVAIVGEAAVVEHTFI
ncbi:hypothetical protein ACP70R_007730 [Stipagrostis hirtigluma subsp. patula]